MSTEAAIIKLLEKHNKLIINLNERLELLAKMIESLERQVNNNPRTEEELQL